MKCGEQKVIITHASYMIFNVSYKSNQYSKHKLFPVLNCGIVNKKVFTGKIIYIQVTILQI